VNLRRSDDESGCEYEQDSHLPSPLFGPFRLSQSLAK
jgi:hypothetical protein